MTWTPRARHYSRHLTAMYGPARCVARDFDELAVSGLASMYPASSWSSVLRAIMGISVDAIFLADRP